MYKVLLADDELLDLEGMKQFIPWTELDMQVVGAVTNGFSACEIMEQQSIDILVTDVNMPNMSGLELARIAIERKPNIQIIFVSGYQDFHYVKQALSLKACSYVLKPMDDNEFISSLRKIKQDLNAEQDRLAAEEAYQSMIPIAKNDLLIRLFEGDIVLDEPVLKKLEAYGLHSWDWPMSVMILELDDMNWKHLEAGKSSKQERMRSFYVEMNEIGMKHGVLHFCKISSHRLAVMMHDRVIQTCVKAMYEAVNTRINQSMTIGAGKPVNDLEELQISYYQALEAIDGKMFIGKGKMICFEEVQLAPAMVDARTLDRRLEALFQAMSNYELVKIHDEIENLFESVSQLRSKYTIHHLAMYIVLKLDQHLQTQEENLFNILELELHNLDILFQFDTIRDIRSWLVLKVYEISEHLKYKNASKNSRLIREIIKMMKGQMHENITLKDIAFQFSFSPNYLGYVFKEEVGKTFSEVLIQLRMERARELLKDPAHKIYEIANQVGYRYLPYFSRQFRETYGMTPMELRKRE